MEKKAKNFPRLKYKLKNVHLKSELHTLDFQFVPINNGGESQSTREELIRTQLVDSQSKI